MNNERTLELAKRILAETESGSLNWVRSASLDSYRLSLGMGMIEIEYNKNQPILSDGTVVPLYSFSIYNERNEWIDGISVMSSFEPNYELIQKLFSTVNKSYLKKDMTIDSMFKALDLPF